jgi:hypothetical protein
MVQIIPAAKQKYSFGSEFGSNFGEGVGKGMLESEERRREDKYREEEDKALRKRGIELSGTREPSVRAALIANDLQKGKRRSLVESSQQIETNPYRMQAEDEEEDKPRRKLPSFLDNKVSRSPKGQDNRDQGAIRNYSTTEEQPSGNQERTTPQIQQRSPDNEAYGKQGSLPETSVGGGKRRIFDADELSQQAHEISRRSLNSEHPISYDESLGYVTNRNEENRRYNSDIEHQKGAAIISEDTYGKMGEEALKRYYPGDTPDRTASPELKALFNRYGEEAAKEGQSQSDIKIALATKAKQVKDQISNLENGLPAGRLWQKTKESATGNKISDEHRINSIKNKVQPLLDMGLYDTTRRILSDKNYGPVEIESIISSLPEGAKKNLATFPALKRGQGSNKNLSITQALPWPMNTIASAISSDNQEYNPEQIAATNDMISKVFKDDPSTNLILLRKALEDKNVDWRTYKIAIDDAILKGNLKLNADQDNQMQYLDEAPLDYLGTILHGINLVGE